MTNQAPMRTKDYAAASLKEHYPSVGMFTIDVLCSTWVDTADPVFAQIQLDRLGAAVREYSID